MGQLSIQIGNLTRSLPADNTKMTAVLTEVVEATGGPVNGTNGEKLDHVLLVIRRHLTEVAQGWRRRKAEMTAQQNAEATQNELELGETPNGSPQQTATRSAAPEADAETGSTGKRSRKRSKKTE